MTIQNDTYYIRYFVYGKKGIENANLCHYKEVWGNNYSVDEYSLDNEGLTFEDAFWSGVSTDDCRAGTKIAKEDYDVWVKRIENCKKIIEKMVYKYSSPYGKMWKAGDYLLFPQKEIIAEEEKCLRDGYYYSFDDEEDKYDGPDFCLLHIINADLQRMEGKVVSIDVYDMKCYNIDKTNPISWYLEHMDKSLLIPKLLFEIAEELIRSTSMNIAQEIKQKVQQIYKL